jgi:hypothetical protein
MGTTVSISINVTEDGKVGMTGPLHDKVVCYGLLEVARDIVRDFKGQAPGLIIPTLVSPSNVKPFPGKMN